MALSSMTVTGMPGLQPLSDTNLLLYGMICMAGADGKIDAAETATLNGFIQQLPEFRDRDHNQAFAEAFALRRKLSPDGVPQLDLLRGLSTPVLKKKLYVLCVDLAMASGGVDQSEGLLLQELQVVLGIDPVTASRVFEVMSLKYATQG